MVLLVHIATLISLSSPLHPFPLAHVSLTPGIQSLIPRSTPLPLLRLNYVSIHPQGAGVSSPHSTVRAVAAVGNKKTSSVFRTASEDILKSLFWVRLTQKVVNIYAFGICRILSVHL